MYIAIGVVSSAVFGVISLSIARSKGRSDGWFWAGALLGLIGMIWIMAMPALRDKTPHGPGQPANLTPSNQFRSDAWKAEHSE